MIIFLIIDNMKIPMNPSMGQTGNNKSKPVLLFLLICTMRITEMIEHHLMTETKQMYHGTKNEKDRRVYHAS